jgi:amino acid permease
LILFPLALPRKVNALRFSSALGVLCAIYLSLAVTVIFWVDNELVADPIENLKKLELYKFTSFGIFSTLPLIIFACMYQFNMPMIYKELRNRSAARMSSVILRGMLVAVTAYIIIGVFGYATFVNDTEALMSENILEAPYLGNIAISIGLISQFFSVLTSSPLTILPCKDTVEQLLYGKRAENLTDSQSGSGKMPLKINVLVTFGLVTVSYGLAISLTSIGDALTIVGSTITPTVGFILPAVFYLKVNP